VDVVSHLAHSVFFFYARIYAYSLTAYHSSIVSCLGTVYLFYYLPVALTSVIEFEL